MNSPLPITLFVILSALVILILYDIYRLLKYGIPGTISHWMWDTSKIYPFFGYLIGFFTGSLITGLAVHFFTP